MTRPATDSLSGYDDGGRPPFAEINITPFVDVMLVLLVIFMVTAPLMIEGVPIELPKVAAAKLDRPRRPVIVSLARDGGLYVRDEKVAPSGITGRLAALRDQEGDAVVYVKADRGVAYGAVMDLVGRVGPSGFSRVSLLTDTPPGGEPQAK